jgi:GST-like protein
LIDLYTWSTPNGRKVSIMLEECGLAYEVHSINIGKDEQFAPEFLKISPNNKIPAIVDRDNGRSLFESGAILIYLAEKTGRFMGETADDRWPVLEWLMWQMGGVGPMLGQAHHFLRFNPGKAPYAEERYGNEAKRLYGVADKRLGEKRYLAGDFLSIADFATWPWFSRFEWQGIDLGDFPNVRRWYVELAGRPGVQRGYDVPAMGHSIPMPA